MPIHEFYCSECDKRFEELIRDASGKADVACPSCKNRNVSRQVSVFSPKSGGRPREAPAFGGSCGRCGDPQGPCGA